MVTLPAMSAIEERGELEPRITRALRDALARWRDDADGGVLLPTLHIYAANGRQRGLLLTDLVGRFRSEFDAVCPQSDSDPRRALLRARFVSVLASAYVNRAGAPVGLRRERSSATHQRGRTPRAGGGRCRPTGGPPRPPRRR